MFVIHNTVRDQGEDCLDVKMYETLTHNEDGLISHTRVYRDDAGKMTQRVLYCRSSEGTKTL
jgi:hypothetical protein